MQTLRLTQMVVNHRSKVNSSECRFVYHCLNINFALFVHVRVHTVHISRLFETPLQCAHLNTKCTNETESKRAGVFINFSSTIACDPCIQTVNHKNLNKLAYASRCSFEKLTPQL